MRWTRSRSCDLVRELEGLEAEWCRTVESRAREWGESGFLFLVVRRHVLVDV